jgi:hypothetical protein
MKRAGESGPRHWAVAGGIALVAVGFVASLFHLPEVAAIPAPSVGLPPVVLRTDDGVDAAFDEQKILADPTPLFLPTAWNAPRKGVARPEPGATFENYQPNYLASEEGLRMTFPSPVAVEGDKVEILIDHQGSRLAGFGRSEAQPPALSERGAFVEIFAEGTGRAVLSRELKDARPPGGGAWQPMEFLGRVDAIGLVGTLRVTQQSGTEGVDDYFRRYLLQTLRIGQVLDPGVYRISVGP